MFVRSNRAVLLCVGTSMVAMSGMIQGCGGDEDTSAADAAAAEAEANATLMSAMVSAVADEVVVLDAAITTANSTYYTSMEAAANASIAYDAAVLANETKYNASVDALAANDTAAEERHSARNAVALLDAHLDTLLTDALLLVTESASVTAVNAACVAAGYTSALVDATGDFDGTDSILADDKCVEDAAIAKATTDDSDLFQAGLLSAVPGLSFATIRDAMDSGDTTDIANIKALVVFATAQTAAVTASDDLPLTDATIAKFDDSNTTLTDSYDLIDDMGTYAIVANASMYMASDALVEADAAYVTANATVPMEAAYLAANNTAEANNLAALELANATHIAAAAFSVEIEALVADNPTLLAAAMADLLSAAPTAAESAAMVAIVAAATAAA